MNIIDNYKTNFTKIIWKYAKKKKKIWNLPKEYTIELWLDSIHLFLIFMQ